jgi:hypothetical protein
MSVSPVAWQRSCQSLSSANANLRANAAARNAPRLRVLSPDKVEAIREAEGDGKQEVTLATRD